MALGIFKKLLGDKTTKDRKEYQPSIEKTNEFQEAFKSLSDDDLRAKTAYFKGLIAEGTESLEQELAQVKAQASDINTNVQDKEVLFDAIDRLAKTIDERIEEILEEIRPEAFAVVKETARRWAENGKLEVTAQQFDKDLAAQKDGIVIEGEKAIWSNTWTAAGAEVTWGMVHYDVQLMGGGVLHKGNIAEMQTGEGKTLVATLPVYLNALSGKGVHVVTVNDYLAKRESE